MTPRPVPQVVALGCALPTAHVARLSPNTWSGQCCYCWHIGPAARTLSGALSALAAVHGVRPVVLPRAGHAGAA